VQKGLIFSNFSNFFCKIDFFLKILRLFDALNSNLVKKLHFSNIVQYWEYLRGRQEKILHSEAFYFKWKQTKKQFFLFFFSIFSREKSFFLQ
jgi:hypothetical protein